MCSAYALASRGGLSLAWTQTAFGRAISGLSQQITEEEKKGVWLRRVTSRLLRMTQEGEDHLIADRVETITADFTGWVYDSPTSVSQNPTTRGYTPRLCVLLSLHSTPCLHNQLHSTVKFTGL